MFNLTPFLPGISHRLSGRQRCSQLDRLRAQSEQWRQSSLSRLCEIFGPWLPAALLTPSVAGINSRQRTCPLPRPSALAIIVITSCRSGRKTGARIEIVMFAAFRLVKICRSGRKSTSTCDAGFNFRQTSLLISN
jgi:hypothetical protein